MRTRYTLVKISSTRTTRNFAKLVGVLLLMALPIAGIGALRLIICTADHAGQTVMECLAGKAVIIHATLKAPKT